MALGSGCYAGVDGFDGKDGAGADGAADGADDEGEDDGAPQSQCGGEAAPGASPIRRLSAWEYDNTIYDLLGDDEHPSASFPQEGGSGFDNNADVSAVTWLMAQKYMLAAEEVSARAVEDLGGLMACDPTTDEAGCVGQWVADFGLRAWRRPLTGEEQAAMVALFSDARAEGEPLDVSVSLVLQAFLQSPHFLYRVELGIPGEQGDAAVRLDDYEMASRLSYLLWGSMPDAALLDAAAAGGLGAPEDIEAQARRMLDDPKARRMVEHFHEQWLGTIKLTSIDKDTTEFPEWSAAISAKQAEEAAAFVDHVFFEGDGTLAELLTAPYTFVDDELAEFYGIEAPAGTGLRRVEATNGAQLSGILSLGGVLSAYSKANMTDPIKRGLFVREHLLCQIPPPPPDDVPLLPPEVDENSTTREQFEAHRDNPVCAACHELFDPIGFGFENYDAVGRWRTTENGFPIDASGELTLIDASGAFDGVAELGGKLAGSEDVAECVTRQWFRFAYGRTESAQLDACNMDTLTARFAESGYDLRELLVSLTQTDAFLYRTAYAAEGGN
ncbi:MAG: DUF1592 domain-containing protein [Myxococcales bacterium]|nr:DUF1592 domain-containing protein [Myxococcales bacterium]